MQSIGDYFVEREASISNILTIFLSSCDVKSNDYKILDKAIVEIHTQIPIYVRNFSKKHLNTD